jgi:glycine cleavage system H protein
MPSPTDRKYLPTHEWAKTITAGQSFGEIESVKATSELYAPVSGKVVAVNEELADNPGMVNSDPWEAGWLIAVEPSNPADMGKLLDATAYDKQLSETGH